MLGISFVRMARPIDSGARQITPPYSLCGNRWAVPLLERSDATGQTVKRFQYAVGCEVADGDYCVMLTRGHVRFVVRTKG